MRTFYLIFFLAVAALISILGFRGEKFTTTPLYIFPDMDWQAKYQPQGINHFFKDHRNDRIPVAGAVRRGDGNHIATVFSSDFDYDQARRPEFYTGKNADGSFVDYFPVPVTESSLKNGHDKFQITCAVCHGQSGNGEGITKSYGMVATASYHDDRLRSMPVGEIFNTITHGKGQMSYYADKLSPQERWDVIAYVRALQRSQHASIQDVPAESLHELGL